MRLSCLCKSTWQELHQRNISISLTTAQMQSSSEASPKCLTLQVKSEPQDTASPMDVVPYGSSPSAPVKAEPPADPTANQSNLALSSVTQQIADLGVGRRLGGSPPAQLGLSGVPSHESLDPESSVQAS